MSLKTGLVLPSDGVKIQSSNVRAFLGDKEFGKGVLCVSEDELIWRQDDGKGLSFSYPHIALHAISSDLNAFPHECLYLIIDKEALEAGEPTEENENESDDSDEIEPLRFVPDDRTFLDPLFKAINECQAMHPDPEDLSDGGEDEGEEEEEEEDENDFRDADDDQQIENFIQANQNLDNIELSDRGRRILNRLNINYESHKNGNGNEHSNEEEDGAQYEDAEMN